MEQRLDPRCGLRGRYAGYALDGPPGGHSGKDQGAAGDAQGSLLG